MKRVVVAVATLCLLSFAAAQPADAGPTDRDRWKKAMKKYAETFSPVAEGNEKRKRPFCMCTTPGISKDNSVGSLYYYMEGQSENTIKLWCMPVRFSAPGDSLPRQQADSCREFIVLPK